MPEIHIHVGSRVFSMQCDEGEYQQTAAAAEILNGELKKWSKLSATNSNTDLLVMAALGLADKVLEAAYAIEEMELNSRSGYGSIEEASRFTDRVEAMREKTDLLTSQVISLEKMVTGKVAEQNVAGKPGK